MTVEILRTDGTRETHLISRDAVWRRIEGLIGATMLDTVNLRDGRVMLVDDGGYETRTEQAEHDGVAYVRLVPVRARKPENAAASALYRAVGGQMPIVGDVAIVIDAEFED